MNKTAAARFGFVARSGIPGDGDGNGLIAGTNGGNAFGTYQNSESLYFWADLSQAGLIEGSFTVPAFPGAGAGTLTANSTPSYNAFPPAKLGQSWIMVYSMGGNNYFIIGDGAGGVQPNGPAYGTPDQLTVLQAYSIDTKTDDGLPQTGRVTTQAILWNTITQWAAGGSNPPATGGWGANPGTAAGASSTTCYDNGGNASNPMQYSITKNGGAGVNCALSFQFQ